MSVDKPTARPTGVPQAPYLSTNNPTMNVVFPTSGDTMTGTATASISINNTNGFFFAGYADGAAPAPSLAQLQLGQTGNGTNFIQTFKKFFQSNDTVTILFDTVKRSTASPLTYSWFYAATNEDTTPGGQFTAVYAGANFTVAQVIVYANIFKAALLSMVVLIFAILFN